MSIYSSYVKIGWGLPENDMKTGINFAQISSVTLNACCNNNKKNVVEGIRVYSLCQGIL